MIHFFSKFKSELAPIIIKIISKDQIFQNFIRFQFQLLDGVDINSLDIEAINSEIYESDIKELTLNSPISNIPDYMRILMTMSIRDSSFVISISPFSKCPTWRSISVNNSIYFYKIDIIDLDIKPINKLSKYIEEIKLHG